MVHHGFFLRISSSLDIATGNHRASLILLKQTTNRPISSFDANSIKMTAILEYPLHDFYARQHAPYSSLLASSATASVCSDASSHTSGSYEPTPSSFSDLSQRYQTPDPANARWSQSLPKPAAPAIVSSAVRPLRQNPRRTSSTATSRTGCPPPLVRQTERKVNFVDNLVGKTFPVTQ